MGREMLLMSNRSLAEDSLTRRPRLCNGKFQLAKKYRELSNLAAACWEKQSQLGELTGWWFLDLEGALRCSRLGKDSVRPLRVVGTLAGTFVDGPEGRVPPAPQRESALVTGAKSSVSHGSRSCSSC